MTSKADAEIGVCVVNDRRIFCTLESLQKLHSRERFQVVVVANGDRDFYRELVSCKEIDKLLWLERPSMPAARNLLLRECSCDLILFTDADVIVDRAWATKLVERLNRGDCSAVGGKIRKLNRETWVQRESDTIVHGQDDLCYLPAAPLPYVVGANCGFVRQHLVDIGGYSEEFRSGNDVDVCYKLGISGRKIGLEPESVVFHDDRRTLSAHFRRYYIYSVYQALLFKRYRHLTGRQICWNSYPWKKYKEAFVYAGRSLALRASRPRRELFQRAIVQAVEASAVLAGDIAGSVRHRVIYI
jgi:hypothetical protein